MSIVIDINALASVFNSDCDKHFNFKPVKSWLDSGRGIVLYGGTKYKDELKLAFRYLKLMRLMKDAGKARALDDAEVDAYEKNVITMVNNKACDDPHIIAILAVSRCNLLCSSDARSYVYIKNKKLYPKGMKEVKIYGSIKNKSLLKY